MKNLNKKQQQEYNELTPEEKKIYDAVMRSFPATKHDSAIDVAWRGGVKWDFIPK